MTGIEVASLGDAERTSIIAHAFRAAFWAAIGLLSSSYLARIVEIAAGDDAGVGDIEPQTSRWVVADMPVQYHLSWNRDFQ
jgi:hypothetical protein